MDLAQNNSPTPSNLHLWKSFFPLEASNRYLDYLLTLSTLKQGQITLFGNTYPTPRLEAFYGEAGLSYTYSNQRFAALPISSILKEIQQAVIAKTQQQFNAVLINYYRNGNDSNGWHADNEPELGKDPIIASVSFGTSRIFQLKSNAGNQRQSLLLEHGDLLLMGSGMQLHWKHCLPKRPKVLEPRINLTFRRIMYP